MNFNKEIYIILRNLVNSKVVINLRGCTNVSVRCAFITEKKKKNAREGSLEENPEVDNVFTISMDSPECLQILFNCQTSRIIIKDVEIKGRYFRKF